MQDWADGDLHAELEQRLDELLAELCPAWQPAELPDPYRNNERFVAYHRRNLKRIQVGDQLTAQPDRAANLAERVLDTIVCDEDVSFNKQLIYPLLDSIGRRRVQRYLISVIETGPASKKVCAVRAWYWSQVSLVYNSMDALQQGWPTDASRAADDDVADLRGQYRAACLAAFVACDHVLTREWLAQGFILKDEFYPPNLLDLVAQARAIAESDPSRFKELLAKNEDGTNMAQVDFGTR
ncbi:hypothetical protein HDA40_001904 [Hamadaea flava]|uniref:Uncharacterized protein n=1 Tax=Hamadaea flava TaxID=1742688 RepID=A0ABV8LE90_9ACTN|nr:hypothetical protein [Hamadaea flava]MCP2323397.1 hypothetical protein [Hamadaea flava]